MVIPLKSFDYATYTSMNQKLFKQVPNTHEYIDIPLLEFVAKRKLTIDVITVIIENILVLPPYEVLKGSSKTLAVYVDEIKLSSTK